MKCLVSLMLIAGIILAACESKTPVSLKQDSITTSQPVPPGPVKESPQVKTGKYAVDGTYALVVNDRTRMDKGEMMIRNTEDERIFFGAGMYKGGEYGYVDGSAEWKNDSVIEGASNQGRVCDLRVTFRGTNARLEYIENHKDCGAPASIVFEGEFKKD